MKKNEKVLTISIASLAVMIITLLVIIGLTILESCSNTKDVEEIKEKIDSIKPSIKSLKPNDPDIRILNYNFDYRYEGVELKKLCSLNGVKCDIFNDIPNNNEYNITTFFITCLLFQCCF